MKIPFKTPLSILASLSLVFSGCHKRRQNDWQTQSDDRYNNDAMVAATNGGTIPWWFWFYHPGYSSYGGHYINNIYQTVPGSPIYSTRSNVPYAGGGGTVVARSVPSSSFSGGKSVSSVSTTSRGGFGGSAAAHASGGE